MDSNSIPMIKQQNSMQQLVLTCYTDIRAIMEITDKKGN